MRKVEDREIEKKTRYKSNKAFSHVNSKSTVYERILPDLHDQYQISVEYVIIALTLSQKIYWWPEGK